MFFAKVLLVCHEGPTRSSDTESLEFEDEDEHDDEEDLFRGDKLVSSC